MIATARGDLLKPAALTTGSSQPRLPGASAQVTGPAAVGKVRCGSISSSERHQCGGGGDDPARQVEDFEGAHAFAVE
jgi:hypothetical protein